MDRTVQRAFLFLISCFFLGHLHAESLTFTCPHPSEYLSIKKWTQNKCLLAMNECGGKLGHHLKENLADETISLNLAISIDVIGCSTLSIDQPAGFTSNLFHAAAKITIHAPLTIENVQGVLTGLANDGLGYNPGEAGIGIGSTGNQDRKNNQLDDDCNGWVDDSIFWP